MDHLSDSELLELLSAEAAETGDAGRHLADCARCRERLAELREPWDALGQWSVEERQVDLTDRIMTQAQSARTIRLWQRRAWVRIAASILIGVGLGSLAGRPQPAPVSDEQAAEAMYLDALALHSPTGWASPLLEETEGE